MPNYCPTLSTRVPSLRCPSSLHVAAKEVVTFGWNEHGMCATGDEKNVLCPHTVESLRGWEPVLVGAGAGHSFVVAKQQVVACATGGKCSWYELSCWGVMMATVACVVLTFEYSWTWYQRFCVQEIKLLIALCFIFPCYCFPFLCHLSQHWLHPPLDCPRILQWWCIHCRVR